MPLRDVLKVVRSPSGFLVSGLILILIVTWVFPDIIQSLLSPGYFMPHAHCYLEKPSMIFLHGVSDFLIGISYMAIAGALSWLVYKARRDLPFEWIFLAFGLFIFSCGWTHFMEVVTLWNPLYWLSGSIKAVTAIASLATAVGIFWLMPQIFKLIDTAKASEQRRHDLEKAHQALERAYGELQAFAYSLSHDMRAPLRTVSSFSSIVLAQNRQQLDASGVMLLEKVVAGAKRMDNLVEDVLTLSRVSQSEMESACVDVQGLVLQLIQERPELQPPKARVAVQIPLLPVKGDRASLNQCLENLLGNAAKFVKPGVTPEIRVYTEAVDGNVRLWVTDNGIGIPAEEKQKIFEPFHRLHSAQEYEGSGIGLAIVQKAVERMGGRVGIESEVGQGSRIWVELKGC